MLQDWYFNKYTSPNSTKAKFIKHIESNLLKTFYEKTKLSYHTADQIIMAVALRKEICTGSRKAYATVECNGNHTRGQVIVDWLGKYKKNENALIIEELDGEKYSEMLVNSLLWSRVQKYGNMLNGNSMHLCMYWKVDFILVDFYSLYDIMFSFTSLCIVVSPVQCICALCNFTGENFSVLCWLNVLL